MTESHDPDEMSPMERAELDHLKRVFAREIAAVPSRTETSTEPVRTEQPVPEGAYKGKPLEAVDLDLLEEIKVAPEPTNEDDLEGVMDRINFDVNGAETGDTKPLTPQMAEDAMQRNRQN